MENISELVIVSTGTACACCEGGRGGVEGEEEEAEGGLWQC